MRPGRNSRENPRDRERYLRPDISSIERGFLAHFENVIFIKCHFCHFRILISFSHDVIKSRPISPVQKF